MLLLAVRMVWLVCLALMGIFLMVKCSQSPLDIGQYHAPIKETPFYALAEAEAKADATEEEITKMAEEYRRLSRKSYKFLVVPATLLTLFAFYAIGQIILTELFG